MESEFGLRFFFELGLCFIITILGEKLTISNYEITKALTLFFLEPWQLAQEVYLLKIASVMCLSKVDLG